MYLKSTYIGVRDTLTFRISNLSRTRQTFFIGTLNDNAQSQRLCKTNIFLLAKPNTITPVTKSRTMRHEKHQETGSNMRDPVHLTIAIYLKT